MQRTNRFVILLTEAEREAIEAWARGEKLSASIAARRLMLLEAEKRGVTINEQGVVEVENE